MRVGRVERSSDQRKKANMLASGCCLQVLPITTAADFGNRSEVQFCEIVSMQRYWKRRRRNRVGTAAK